MAVVTLLPWQCHQNSRQPAPLPWPNWKRKRRRESGLGAAAGFLDQKFRRGKSPCFLAIGMAPRQQWHAAIAMPSSAPAPRALVHCGGRGREDETRCWEKRDREQITFHQEKVNAGISSDWIFLLLFYFSMNLDGRRAPKIFGNGFFTSILLRVNYCMTIVWVLAALGCNLMEKKLNCQFVGWAQLDVASSQFSIVNLVINY